MLFFLSSSKDKKSISLIWKMYECYRVYVRNSQIGIPSGKSLSFKNLVIKLKRLIIKKNIGFSAENPSFSGMYGIR